MSRSMDKSMRLIDLVAEGCDTLPELAKAADYPKSTAYRLLTVLEAHGWLRRSGNRYELGFRILELAGQLRASLQLPMLARPLMEKAAAAAQETIHLGQLEGARIVYIEKVSGGRGFEMASRVGMTMPAHCTGLGKVLVSQLAEDQWKPVLTVSAGQRALVPPVLAQLPVIRSMAAALDEEENETGIRCVAVPIWNGDATVPAALSMSGPTFHVTWERLPTILDLLRECSIALSRELGGARFAEEAFRVPSADTIAELHRLSAPRAATA